MRLLLYAEAQKKIKRKTDAHSRILHLIDSPGDLNDDDLDMFRECDGRTLRHLFEKQPGFRLQFRDYNDSPEQILSTLSGFTRRAWPYIKDSARFAPNWHIDLLGHEYEELFYGNNDRLIVNQPPGTMKPIAEFESVMTQTGPKMLKDIVVGDMVLTHMGRFRKVTAVHEQGELDVLKVSMNSARTVVAAGDHPFLTTRGWINAQDLIPGSDYCGVPVIKEKMTPHKVMKDEEARLLGYIVGDGCVKYNAYTFTSADQHSIDDFIRCAEAIGFYAKDLGPRTPLVKTHTISLRSTPYRWNTKRDGVPPVKQWLRSHGLDGSCSYTKFIPKAVFCGGESAIRNFLAAYVSSDGHIGIRHTTKTKRTMAAKCSTVSNRLANDVMQAMWMVGISTRVRRKEVKLKSKRQGDTFVTYETLSEARNEVRKIADLPGLLPRKKIAGEEAFADKFERNIWEDQVVDVQPAGKANCRCLTVEGDRSFVVNGIAVHNTYLLQVFFPAWVWAKNPTRRFGIFSYSEDPMQQPKQAFLHLITSDWWQKRFGRLRIVRDNEKEGIVNSKGGSIYRGTVGGPLTGMHPHFLLIDDPHKSLDVYSQKLMRRALRWFASSVASRGMMQRMAIVVCMQRLAPNDLCGALLGEMLSGAQEMPDELKAELEDLAWRHACLPMRFDPDHRYRWDKDPRKKKGDLLWESVLTEAIVRSRIKLMELAPDQANVPAQFDQDPVSKAGTLFENVRGSLIKPEDLPKKLVHGMAVRGWDRADSNAESDGDPTAGVLTVEYEGIKYIVNRVKFQKMAADRNQTIENVSKFDKGRWDNYRAANEVNPGPDGKFAHNDLAARLSKHGIICMSQPATKNKAQRATQMAAGIKYGEVRILDNQDWTNDFVEELIRFPNAPHDDQVDAGAHSYNGIEDWKAGRV